MAATLSVIDNSGTTTDKSITFPSTALDATSTTQDFFLKNTGDAPLNVTAFPTSNTAFPDFTFIVKDPTNVTANSSTFTIAANQQFDVQVKFHPVTTTGIRNGTISFHTNDAGNANVSLALTGTAAAGPFLTIPNRSITLPTTAVGSTSTSQNFSLTNSGTQTLNITSFTQGGTNSADFSFKVTNDLGQAVNGVNASTPPTTFSIPAGKTYTVAAQFSPLAGGSRSATLTFASNDPGNPTVVLTASGTANPAPTTVPAAPTNFTAVATSPTSITLNWQHSGGTETGFKVAESTSPNGQFNIVAQPGAGVHTTTRTNLIPGTHYFYRLAATNAIGDSDVVSTDVITPVTDDTAGNTIDEAKSLGRVYNMTISGNISDNDTIDFYAIKVPNTGFIRATLNNLHADADLTLFQVAGNGHPKVLALSDNGGTTADKFLKKLTPGVYYIRVAQGVAGQATSYSLTLTGNYAGDTLHTGRKLGPLRKTLGFVGNVGPDAPADFFQFTNSRRRNISINLFNLQHDADLYLFDSRGKRIALSENDGADTIARNLSAGIFYVKVLEANNQQTSYSLSITAG